MKDQYCKSDSDNGHCDNKVHMNMSIILNGYRRKVNTRDKLLARILDAAASIKKCEDQLRRTTRCLGTRVAKCTEVEDGTFRTFIVFCNIISHFCVTFFLYIKI
jgi:hypothetical protein